MPTESSFQPFQVPDRDCFTYLFDRKTKPFPDDKVILRDAHTGRSYTWQETKNTAVEFGKGDVLALFTPNCVDTPPVMWGTHWAGGLISPANSAYTVDELAYQLKDCGAKGIVTQMPLLDTVLKAAKLVNIGEDRIILMGDEKDTTYKFKHFTSVRNLAGTSRYRKSKVDAKNDLAFLPYSSGTTGRPKGVMLTHTNVLSNMLQNHANEGRWMTPKDKMLAFLPFFHIYGLVVLIHHCFWAGYELVVMPKYDIEKFCQAVQQHKITFGYVAPPVVLQLSKHPIVDKYDLSSLRIMNSGAAPLTQELVKEAYARIKIPVKQGYGLTETSPTTHAQPWDRWETAIGSAGVLLPNQLAMFVDAEDKEVPVGGVGELWIKGPNVFKGYLNNKEGTANALTSDGWFKTGDIGYHDEEGNFFITDRVKELIKYKGFQVPPAELEGKLVSHPKVADACVLGIYSKEQATELPRAYLVTKDGQTSDAVAQEIVDWVKANVANHKQLRGGVRFVNEIPKSASGKILRRVLKEQAQKEMDSPRAKL
ncbi:MAG: hypothetical protein Q9162_005574 [Coniocarpon cinnabarinum]